MPQLPLFPHDLVLEKYSPFHEQKLERLAARARIVAPEFQESAGIQDCVRDFHYYVDGDAPPRDYFTIKEGSRIIGFAALWDGRIDADDGKAEPKVEMAFLDPNYHSLECVRLKIGERLRAYK